jgi:DNA-binding MarR family transcriptional regulator
MTNRFETFMSSISTVYRCVQRIKSIEMTELGLKGGHALCLFYLSRSTDGLTAAELCALTDEDKAAISRETAELEEAGFLTRRTGAGGRNYRAKLTLTLRGREAAQDLDRRIERVLNHSAAGLSDTELDDFYKGLLQIADNLQDYCDEKMEEQQA